MAQNLKGVYVMPNNSEITKVEQLLKDSDITKPLVNYVHIAFMLGYEKAKEKFERKQGHWEKGNCSVCGESAATDGHFDFIAEEEQKYCWNCGAIMEEKKGKGLLCN